ncbi:MAG: hypothetical protein QG594_1767 [Bacteroidota bacterium]|nr:hypothetical protein [Bacteroidota bacterium]
MKYKIWYSTEDFADYIIENTSLKNFNVEKQKICESDANNAKKFHTMPDHIKKILYLDSPDLIIEQDNEPILSIEISREAGTGHNAFQRFARLAAAVENNVPAFYIYPEAAIINRHGGVVGWDKINPLVFKALDSVMNIYKIPALLFYYPSDFREFPNPIHSPNIQSKGLKMDTDYIANPDSTDSQMKQMFKSINTIIECTESKGLLKGREMLLGNIILREQRDFMNQQYSEKKGTMDMSPLSATCKIDTEYLINYLEKKYNSENYQIGELLRNRKETIIYKVNAKFRGDPYPGALAAIDYLLCREGTSFEDRRFNLVLVWGELKLNDTLKELEILDEKGSSIEDFVKDVKNSESKNLLTKGLDELKNEEIPRYYMQVRYGSTFSKVKHIRVYSYFADAIIFPDGSLWRDA